LAFFSCFLFSSRFTGGGAPKTARDAAFTALVALNFFSFFFFGTMLFNHESTFHRATIGQTSWLVLASGFRTLQVQL
jgi:hypothetical protein